MATITDPQVIAFVNAQERPACDRVASAVRTLRQLVANYQEDGIGPLVVGTPELENSYVADGSVNADGGKGDGRTPLLGYDVDNVIVQANALLAWLAANPNVEKAFTKPSVNSQPII